MVYKQPYIKDIKKAVSILTIDSALRKNRHGVRNRKRNPFAH